MTSDQEPCAEALAIEAWKGAETPAYIAERITALAAAGDLAGWKRFVAIGERWMALHDATRV